MADFSFKTWQTMNIEDLYLADSDVNFLILDHESEYNDPSDDPDILYSGVRPANMLYKNLENILSPKMTMENYPAEYYPEAWGDERRKTFYLYESPVEEDWGYYEMITIELEYDWSYIPDRAYMSELSNPIEYKIDPRQYITWTSQQVVPGTTNRITAEVEGSSEPWWTIINDPNSQTTLHLQCGDFAGYTPGTIVIINNLVRLELVEQCADYCIYYMNRIGGWDWLLVKGRSIKKDKINRLQYKKNYVAQDMSDFNKVTYSGMINETWELSTSWLTDSQSEKMPDLLESNKVLLHDLRNIYITPVLVTNSNVEYKTYKNQGRKLYSYSIEVEASKPKFRI